MKTDYISALTKTVRQQLGLSQEDLARELGVSFSTINRWENGRAKPSKMAQATFGRYCKSKIKSKKLELPGVEL